MSENSFLTFKQMLYKICNQCSSRVTKSSQESEFSLEKKGLDFKFRERYQIMKVLIVVKHCT